MPSIPRGRNAATVIAVVLAILLALLWLRTSGGDAPAVPVGLPVSPPPVTVAQPADSTGLGQGGDAEAEEPARVGGIERRGRRPGPRRRKRADRAGRARAPRKQRERGAVGSGRHDSPAAAPPPAPAPTAGSGGAGSGGAQEAPPAPSPQPAAPEFALG